jgi:hypothetical protein
VLVVTTAGDLTREAFYLEQALIAPGADGRAYEAEGVPASDLAGWEQTRLDRHTAIVLTSTRGLEHRGRQMLSTYLKNGGGLLVTAGPDLDGDVLDELLAGPKTGLVPDGVAPRDRVTRTWAAADVRHPVVRAFGAQGDALGLVRFQRVTPMRPEGCQTLARFTTGEPALVDCSAGEGHALVVASDLDNRGNDFPLRATFVPFLHEAVRYLAGGERRTAEYFVADVPAGVPPVPGVAPIGTSPASQWVAVNIDPVETDPGRLTREEFLTAVAPLSAGQPAGASLQAREQEERQRIWQYALAGMLLLLLAESYVAARIA